MKNELDNILSKSGVVVRTIKYGGLRKIDLLERLSNENVNLNEYAKVLFSSDLYETSKNEQSARIIELSIEDLGFSDGAIFANIIEKIKMLNLKLCSLDIGPYLRLDYKDQKEEVEHGRNKAPKGSITIFSQPVFEQNEDFPKGFYIRKMDGKLWLRGYVSPMDYIWEPSARIILEM